MNTLCSQECPVHEYIKNPIYILFIAAFIGGLPIHNLVLSLIYVPMELCNDDHHLIECMKSSINLAKKKKKSSITKVEVSQQTHKIDAWYG